MLRLVAVVATRQQDAGSWKTLHVLLLRAVYRLSEAARMLSRESRMLHEKYAMKIHVRGHGHVAFRFPIVALCRETQLDATRRKTTPLREDLVEDPGA